MANTRDILKPNGAEFPSTAFPERRIILFRPVLAFDATVVETAFWTKVAPQGLTGTMHALVYYFMASATSGKVDWEVSIEAITDADALDLDAAASFAAPNGANATVPATAGYMDVIDITLTNDDGIAAGDYVRYRLQRDADDATDDTAAGDAHMLFVEIRDDV